MGGNDRKRKKSKGAGSHKDLSVKILLLIINYISILQEISRGLPLFVDILQRLTLATVKFHLSFGG